MILPPSPASCRLEVTLCCKSCINCRAMLPPESLPQVPCLPCPGRCVAPGSPVAPVFAGRIWPRSEGPPFAVAALGCLGMPWDALGCLGMPWDALGTAPAPGLSEMSYRMMHGILCNSVLRGVPSRADASATCGLQLVGNCPWSVFDVLKSFDATLQVSFSFFSLYIFLAGPSFVRIVLPIAWDDACCDGAGPIL